MTVSAVYDFSDINKRLTALEQAKVKVERPCGTISVTVGATVDGAACGKLIQWPAANDPTSWD